MTEMNTPMFQFEQNCPDGQKCGATTTGCQVGKCQRKGTITCKHWLNLQAGESHTLTIAGAHGCPVCRAEATEARAARMEKALRELLDHFDFVVDSQPKSRLHDSVVRARAALSEGKP